MTTYYKDHWEAIDDGRLARYEAMFEWRPEQDASLAALELENANTVLDFGSGPGFLALRIAELLGPGGEVHGVELNERFVNGARSRANEAGLEDRVHFHHVTDEQIPLPTQSVDRVICKNVLEYVPDVVHVLGQFFRVLKPGGRVLVMDSDWGFVLVNPWTPEEVRAFFTAAGGAFREPYIGRRAPMLLKAAGFADVSVSISTFADTQGRAMGVLRNMEQYARDLGALPEAQVDALMARLDKAIDEGSFLFSLPQFLVSARRPT